MIVLVNYGMKGLGLMHYIEKRFGKDDEIEYEVGIYGQGGYERSICRGPDAEQRAIKEYKTGIRFLSGFRESLDGIHVPVIRDQTVWPHVVADEGCQVTVTNDQFHTAVGLAGRSCQFRPGVRYQLRVVFTEVDEPFVGDGI